MRRLVMTDIPLITSIPPRLSRLDSAGVDFGDAYQSDCIASWRSAGFDPISVNSADEAHTHAVRVIPVGRDASAITGRPNVYLGDLLAVACIEANGGSFAITNADISFPRASDLSAKV